MSKPLHLDGQTGEGGGQLVRLAVTLAALTTQPITITNIRGNRPTPGLKSQHITSIKYLAQATQAEVTHLEVGSKSITFMPKVGPSSLVARIIKLKASSPAASTLLILQAVFPFLLYASGPPITLEILGGTNVSFSLSYEYLDQVLLPTLEEQFGVVVERQLKSRAWSLGKQGEGAIILTFQPLMIGEKLTFRPCVTSSKSHEVQSVDVSIIVPAVFHSKIQTEVAKRLEDVYPRADIIFKATEDSGHDARWCILLVAHSKSGLRWGRDILTSLPKKTKSHDAFISLISRKVCKELCENAVHGGHVDEHLQDQIVIFQALCDKLSSLPRHSDYTWAESLIDDMELVNAGERMRKEKTGEPFGHGSLHTQTARWVVSELLPAVGFFNKGDIVRGIGFAIE